MCLWLRRKEEKRRERGRKEGRRNTKRRAGERKCSLLSTISFPAVEEDEIDFV